MQEICGISIYKSSPDSLKEVLKLSGALDDFKLLANTNPNSKILIKPNLVAWIDEINVPMFGVLTTTRLVEDLIIILKQFNLHNIWIGEGGVKLGPKSDTKIAFEKLGYYKLKQKYKIELIDFNESKPKKINIKDKNNEFTLEFAEDACNWNYFINIPVLKTHSQTKISLGIKNLKGCLKTSSKKFCHDSNLNLEHYIQFIPDIINPNLNIIDGIFALEQGPLYFGKPYKKNLIIASKDVFVADLVGAKILGYEVNEINHLSEYAERKNKSKNLNDYSILGEDIEKHSKRLEWDWLWNKENTGPEIFDKIGIKNIAIPKYDASLCSGCSPIVNMINVFILNAYKNHGLPESSKIEILCGKRMQAREGYDKTLLLGSCIINANKNNKNIKNPIKITGCPPSNQQIIKGLKEAGLKFEHSAYKDYLIKLSKRFENNIEFNYKFFQVEDN